MLLRRQQQQQQQSGREIALSRFCTVGALAEPAQRLKWIDHVASAYARACASSNPKGRMTPLQWDLQSTLPLIFHCALLPAGSEFLPICEAITPPHHTSSKPSPFMVIHQEEVLARLFLPKTKKVLADPNAPSKDTINVLTRTAALTFSYIGALERHGSSPCPSLQVFVFALLWRLGDAPAIQARVKYRTWNSKCQSCSPTTYMGNKRYAFLLMAIVETVEFGAWSIDKTGLRETTGKCVAGI